jgi:hypothetical protein
MCFALEECRDSGNGLASAALFGHDFRELWESYGFRQDYAVEGQCLRRERGAQNDLRGPRQDLLDSAAFKQAGIILRAQALDNAVHYRSEEYALG